MHFLFLIINTGSPSGVMLHRSATHIDLLTMTKSQIARLVVKLMASV